MKRLFYILAALFAISCAENVVSDVEDVEVGPYTVSVIDKNVYHIQDYNSEYLAGVGFFFIESAFWYDYVKMQKCPVTFQVIAENNIIMIIFAVREFCGEKRVKHLSQMGCINSDMVSARSEIFAQIGFHGNFSGGK